MFCAFSFGLLGAYLIEKSSRKIFFHKIALEKLAVTDPLTGIYNRSKLDEILQKELNRSQRFELNFGVLLLDIDFFKKVNDEHGHEWGDQVLVAFSDILKRHVRKTDALIRWGGEEFVIIYLGTNERDLLDKADAIRLEIEAHEFERIGSKSVSIGVTTYREGDSVGSIMKRADVALYNAKEAGRNRVEFV
jgi:diguanylate cyclase (GGDEF)-like protein